MNTLESELQNLLTVEIRLGAGDLRCLGFEANNRLAVPVLVHFAMLFVVESVEGRDERGAQHYYTDSA